MWLEMSRVIPKYPHRAGGKFIPLEPGDYEDGGAYPEIHVVQYPLRMGDPSFKRASTVSLAVTATGMSCFHFPTHSLTHLLL